MNKGKFRYLLKKLALPLFALALALAFLGSYQVYHGKYGDNLIKEVIVIGYSILKLFTFFPTISVTEAAPLAYEVAVWLAPASTMVGFFTIFQKIYQRIRLTFYHLNQPHMAILGYNEHARTFMNQMSQGKNAPRFYVLFDEGDDIPIEELHRLGYREVILDFQQPKEEYNRLLLRDFKIKDCQSLVSFLEDPDNYSRVVALGQMMPSLTRPMDLYLRNQNVRLKELMEAKLDEIKSFDLHYFKVEELLVRQLLSRDDFSLKMPDIYSQSWQGRNFTSIAEISAAVGHLHLLIIGFSEMAETFLIASSNQMTLNPKEPLEVTIVDEEASKKFALFASDRKGVGKVMKVDLIDEDIRLFTTQEKLKEHQRQEAFSLVLFAQDDFMANVLAADHLLADFQESPFVLYTKKQKGGEALTQSLTLRHPKVMVFGDAKDILNERVLLREDLLRKAKSFNASYQETMNELLGYASHEKDPEKLWQELSTVKKESNEYQGAHQSVKENLLNKLSTASPYKNGHELLQSWAQKLSHRSIPQQVDILEGDAMMNFMTALEHQRWNNYHYMRGFTLGEKNEIMKTHDCLIDDWNEFLKGPTRDKAIYDTLSSIELLKHTVKND